MSASGKEKDERESARPNPYSIALSTAMVRPRQVHFTAGTKIVKIAAGQFFSVGLAEDGDTIYTFGSDGMTFETDKRTTRSCSPTT